MTEVTIRGRTIERSPARPAGGGPMSPGAHGGLLHEAPALLRRDWLPEGATPELDELHEQHNALLDRAREVNGEIRAIEERHEAEDAERAEALRAQARGQVVEIPVVTPPEERAAELAPLREEGRAVAEVLEQFVAGAIADITDNYADWTAALDEEDAVAAARVAEAERALAEAKAGLGTRAQLRGWLQRTAGRHPIFGQLDARHIPYGDLAGIAGPQPEREPEPTFGAPAPTVPAISPEARALQLAERAARHDTDTIAEEDQ